MVALFGLITSNDVDREALSLPSGLVFRLMWEQDHKSTLLAKWSALFTYLLPFFKMGLQLNQLPPKKQKIRLVYGPLLDTFDFCGRSEKPRCHFPSY